MASHNIMDGLQLPELLQCYTQLQARGVGPSRTRGLGFMLLQENVPIAASKSDAAAVIARRLGPRYSCARCDDEKRLAIVFDRQRFRHRGSAAVTLPQLPSLTWFERLYIKGPGPELKRALLSTFEERRRGLGRGSRGSRGRGRHRRQWAVVNIHLDAAGSNDFRRTQMDTVSRALLQWAQSLRWDERSARRFGEVIVGGDTNCFALGRERQSLALRDILGPLRRQAIEDTVRTARSPDPVF